MEKKKIIVVSAVNIIEGGALSILKDVLSYLDDFAFSSCKVIAIVNNKKYFNCPNIDYIELPWAKRTWFHRLYCEYFYFKKVSRQFQASLWLSMHDTTPNVYTEKQAVYCHNPSPFYSPSFGSLWYNYKEYLFSRFYKYLYKINIKKNNHIIVQQHWIKQEFLHRFALDEEKVIVSYPAKKQIDRMVQGKVEASKSKNDKYIFFYPAFPRTFKNFEIIAKACEMLETQGNRNFEVILTIDGTENRYARSISAKYNRVGGIRFAGLMKKEEVEALYQCADCLIFPSKLETWGLPVSEFLPYGKPLLLADLPYARETASGAAKVYFFNPDEPFELAQGMAHVMRGELDEFVSVPVADTSSTVCSWHQLFDILLEQA